MQWAQSEQANGCTLHEANPLHQQVSQMNISVAAAKQSFVADWNSVIAPTYAAPRFETSQI